jgi:type II secretory pathway component GspD/PulD (secretin)
VCGAAMGLPLTGFAQTVRQVQVSDSNGRVDIHIIGVNLPKPEDVTWRKGIAYTLEWRAGLQSPGGRIRVDTGDVKSVWYGWYTAHPHSMRVQVQLNNSATPEVREEASGWVITFGGAKPAAPAKPKLTEPKNVAVESANPQLPIPDPAAIPMRPKTAPANATLAPRTSVAPAPGSSTKALGVSDASPKPEAAVNKQNSERRAPVVVMSPPLARWAMLEKLDKDQVQKPSTTLKPVPTKSSAISDLLPSDIQSQGGFRRVTIDCSNADLSQVIKGLALQSGANIVIGPALTGKVTANLHDVTIDHALKYISYLTGVKYEMQDGIYMFGVVPTPMGATPIHPATPITRTLFTKSEQEGRIVLLLASQFAGSGLVMISSEKTEDKSDHKSDSDTTANYQALLTAESVVLGRHFIIFVGPEEVVNKAMAMSREVDEQLMVGFDQESLSQELYPYDVKFADPRALRESLISQVQGLRVVIAPNAVGNFDTYKEGKTKTQSTEQSRQEDLAQSNNNNTNANSQSSAGSVQSVNTNSVDDGALEAPFSKEEAVSVPMRLIFRGSHDQVLQALKFAKVLDTPPRQVALELRVMELTKSDALNAGIDWSIVTGGAVKVLNLNNAQTSANNTASISISGKGFNGDVTASLDALAEKNKLVARPNLVAMDGRQSEVFIGDIVRYVESITQSQNGTTVTTGEVPVGVRLSVLPRIGADGNMTLDLRPRVSLLTSFTSVPGGGQLPQTSSRFAQSTISLQSGQTIAIGGLIQDQDVKTLSGIPILMNLPIIGPLFRSTTLSKERTELVIFLTARTLNGPVGNADALPMMRDLKDPKALGAGN